MTARFILPSGVANPSYSDTYGALLASCHLSDGTAVFLTASGFGIGGGTPASTTSAPAASLWYSSDHKTARLIGAVTPPATYGAAATAFGRASSYALCRDSSDNIYVGILDGTSVSGSNLSTWGFTKGTGTVWTPQARVDGTTTTTTGHGLAMVWCNTGGGTNSKGHLMMIWCDVFPRSGYATLDAGVILAGTGTLIINNATNPTFLGTPTTDGISVYDIEPDGFGATAGIAAQWHTSTTLSIGSWAVSAAGALTTNTNITVALTTGAMGAGTCKVRIVNTASNVFCVLFLDSGGSKVTLARYSKTASLTAATTYGTVTDFGANGNGLAWDATYDPTGAKLWLYGPSATTPDTMLRLGCTVSAGISWDSTAVTDETSVTGYATGAQRFTTVRTIKKQIAAANGADWQVDATDGAGNYQTAGGFSPFVLTPNAPTLTGPTDAAYVNLAAATTFSWTPNHPDVDDIQYAYAFRKKNAVAAKTISNVALTSNVATITTSTAHGLVVGDVITNSGLATTALNVTAVVTTIPSTTTFTFALTNVNIASTADAGTETPNYGYWNGTDFSNTAAVWTNLSPISAVTIPANVFGANGSSYVWSVATENTNSLAQGAFATNFSLLTYAAPVVTVTAPSGAITTSTLPAGTWTYTQSQGLPQASYRVLVYDTTVTAAPVPGTDGLQSWDSGTVYSTAVTATPTKFLTNAHNFKAYVLATIQNGSTSGWSSVTFNLNVTVPTTPTLTASYSSTTGRTTLTGTGTAAGGFAYTNTTMWFQYSDDSGTTWYDVRSSTAIAPNSSFIGTTYDYEGIPGASRSYRVMVVNTARTILSLVSTTQTATAAPTDWWVKNPSDPTYNVAVGAVTEGDISRRLPRGTFDILGLSTPVVVKDVRHAVEEEFQIQTTTSGDHDKVAAMLNTGDTLLVQSPSSFGVNRYIEPGDTTESRLDDGNPRHALTNFWIWKVPYLTVATP